LRDRTLSPVARLFIGWAQELTNRPDRLKRDVQPSSVRHGC
jgi:hypothetical protein